MAITEQTGFPAGSANLGSSPATLAVTTVAVGDLLICAGRVQISATGTMTSSVSGGGVTNWTQAVDLLDTTVLRYLYLWWGTVSTTGAGTISVTISGTATIGGIRVVADSFTAPSQAWTLDAAANISNSVSSTTLTLPTLTPTKSSLEMYWGYELLPASGTFSGGTPAG